MSHLSHDVLIIGAGITGMQAALDLADKGFRVVIVDKQASIGGTMVKLDKTFPTNDCSICIAAPKMVEIARHPNIELLTYAEVERVTGSEGHFQVSVWKRTNYVDPAKCTGCSDCARVCPVEVRDLFNEKLSKRKAIYIQFPQAVPALYTIDYENCVGCGACDRACTAGAISFLKTSQEVQLSVGSIIVATGFDVLEPIEIRKEYGYGRYKNVTTALQYERILSASGPTAGKVQRPSDGQKPRRIAWIQCVGSRSKQHGNPYCSKICCMYATKEASITLENNPDIEPTIFYMDLRAYGKDFQQYYQKAASKGVRYIRGRPSSVCENADHSLTIAYENTLTSEVHEEIFDMVVLSTSVIPSPGNRRLAQLLEIEIDEYGFFVQQDILLEPMKSTREGIFLAGSAQGPQDIPDSVAQASGAACKAAIPVRHQRRSLERVVAAEKDVTSEQPRTGVFVCRCGKNIGAFVDVANVASYAASLPGVVFADENMFACSEDAQRRIKDAIAAHNLNRVVVAACSPITHAAVFQQTCEEVGINKNLFEMANIRNQCSWVHSDNIDLATEKSKDLVRMAVSRSAYLKPLPKQQVAVTKSCLVIGGGIAGIKAALNMADLGIDTYLVERSAVLGGKLRDLHLLSPLDVPASDVLRPLLKAVEQRPNLTVFTSTEIRAVDGYVGNFEVELASQSNGMVDRLTIGTIIVATGFEEIDLHGRYGYGQHPNIITQMELEQRLKTNSLGQPRRVVMLNCAGSMDESNPSCCRIGCSVSVKNTRLIKRALPNTHLVMLYQDLRMFGKREEEYFSETLEQANPTLIRYTADRLPSVSVRDGAIFITVFDALLGEEIEIESDLLVLTAAMRGDAQTPHLKKLLKISANAENFYAEAHAKIRPLDFATDGVYLCGSAHYPKNIADTIAQAEGAASRAAIPIMLEKVGIEPIIAEIDEARCAGCGICVTLCPYNAVSLDTERRVAVITDVMCKGCGTCVAACPSGASQQRNFTDAQLLSMIETAWSSA